MNVKKIKAVAYLGLHIILHFLKKIFKIKQRHKKDFIQSYKADRIFAITAHQRTEMPAYSRCYQCRLCDTVCPELATNPKLLAPSYLVGSFSRSLTDFYYYETVYDCLDCQKCEDICPQDVPIKEIIEFMKYGKEAISA